MSSDTRLLFLAGSAREASLNKRLAKLGARIAEANGIPATFADLSDYPLPLYNGDLQDSQGIPDNAMKASGISWTEDELRKWIANNTEMLPGTRMKHMNVTDKLEQDFLIDYLKGLK